MVALTRTPCDAGLAHAAGRGDGAALTPAAKRAVLAATVLGSSLAFIDGSVVNVALPALQRGLGAGGEAVQWAVNGYLLMLGALVLIGGAAADRFGRRRVFLIGLTGFSAASLVCAAAPGIEVLLAGRILQGIGAALVTPASLAILGSSFPQAERARAVGSWAGFGALAAAAGPVLGGWLVDAVSWRAIFLINLPVAAAAGFIAWRAMPESRGEPETGLDLPGAGLAAVGLGCITLALTRAGAAGFGGWQTPALLAGGAAALAAFVRVEGRSKHPMTPPALFRSAPFVGANLLTLGLYFAIGGSLFFLPFELIRVRGWSATAAGAALLPLSLMMGAFSGLAGRLADRVGARTPLVVGPPIAGLGLALMALTASGGSYWTGLLPATLVLAAGMTLAVAPLTSTVMGAVGEGHAGTASGVNNAVARIAGLLAVAALALVFAKVFDQALAGTPGAPAAGSALAVDPSGAPPALREAERAALDQAFRVVSLISAACAALSAVPAALFISSRPAPSDTR